MYANSQFERNAPFSVKKTKPFILIYIVATSKGWCHHFGASQTSRYHPHWCIGFSRASQLASQCYELRFFLSLDLPELTSWLYLRSQTAALLCSSNPALPDSSLLSATQTSIPAGNTAGIAHLQTGKHCQPLALPKNPANTPQINWCRAPGVRTDTDAERNSHPESQWQKENIARVSMTGEHSLRMEGGKKGKVKMILWTNHKKQNRTCPIREDRADADSLSPLHAEKQSLAMCLHV